MKHEIMTIEEKAKHYDEAIDKIGDAVEAGTIEQGLAEWLFPELKESEDEQHRKWILEYLYDGLRKSDEQFKDQFKSAIAWFERQDKQKPADSVKTKFHEGDWVVDNCGNVWKIEGILNQFYILKGVEGDESRPTIEWVDKTFHLWTIDDAKDGDVLSLGNVITIFKKYIGQEKCICYCSICEGGDFEIPIENGEDNVYGCTNTVPATKEQCNFLFYRMKGKGYVWYETNKELKKIKDEEYNGEDYGIDSLYHAQRILEKTLGKVDGYQSDDGILEHKCAISAVKKLYEQKPAWSEEDETKLTTAQTFIRNTSLIGNDGIKEATIDWLKSLKDRVQTQDKWTPSDEQMATLEYYMHTLVCNEHKEILFGLYTDLKKLKNK